MQPQQILEYSSPEERPVVLASWPVVTCATFALFTSFIPVWGNYSSIGLLPGFVGWPLVLAGLLPLWKMHRWGVFGVLVGSTLLSMELAMMLVFFVMGAMRVWRYFRLADLADVDLSSVLTVIAFVLSVQTVIMLIRRLKLL
jgi:hypothetical protein